MLSLMGMLTYKAALFSSSLNIHGAWGGGQKLKGRKREKILPLQFGKLYAELTRLGKNVI